MEFRLLAKGLLVIAAAISLTNSEPRTIDVESTSESDGFDGSSRWKCNEKSALNIVLKEYYEDNIDRSFLIQTENECQLNFEFIQLRNYNGVCIDSITFVYSNKNETVCHSKSITTPKGIHNISITIRTTTCKDFSLWTQFLCLWNVKKLYKGGFTLTLRGVSSSGTTEKTSTAIKAGSSETAVSSTEAGDEDSSELGWQGTFPNCSEKELFNDTTHNTSYYVSDSKVIDCNSMPMIIKSDMSSHSAIKWIDEVVRKIMSNESQCTEWCDLIVPNVTDVPILYLNETHVFTADLKSKRSYLISCNPAGGNWSSTPPCQGFKSSTARNAPPSAFLNVAGIVSGAVVGVIAVAVILIAIGLIVRRKSQSTTKRAQAADSADHGDAPIEMEDNPVYG